MEDREIKDQIELEKMLALIDLIPAFAHRLNNHLTPVMGYGQLLLLKTTDSEAKENLKKIIDETQQASQIIRDLVSFLRKARPEKKALDINDLIGAVLETKSNELTVKRIEVQKGLSRSVPLTLADPKQMKQVLFNVMNNAVEAISEFHGFGKISVKTRVSQGRIEILISDDGPGMSEEHRSKVLDPFFTTKKTGAGLGLTISHDIMTEHEGAMKVESEWGRGTTVILTLPILETKGRKQRKTLEESLRGKKGLIVDDEPGVLGITSAFLEKEGCEAITTLDAKTAIRIIGEKEIDFVICDMKMPGMDGSEFYRVINATEPSLSGRIVFMTGDTLNEATKKFIDSTTNPHIEKPFSLEELKKAVISVLG